MRSSETTAKIFPAIVAAAADLRNPPKTATAKMGQYSYSYAKLPDILDAVKPVLAKNGLAVLQETLTDDGAPAVRTLIVHSSGEWLLSDAVDLPPTKPDPQGIGGALSYARRYSLTAMLGIAGEDDDDAGYASSGGGERRSESRPPPDAGKGGSGRSGTISDKQAKYLHVLVGKTSSDAKATEAAIKAKYGVEHFSDLPWKPGKALIDKLKAELDAREAEGQPDGSLEELPW